MIENCTQLTNTKPASNAPIFSVDRLTYLTLETNSTEDWFQQLHDCVDHTDVAELTWTIACRLSSHVPHLRSLSSVCDQIEQAVSSLQIHPFTIRNILEAVIDRVEGRHRAALTQVQLPNSAKSSHHYSKHPDGLPHIGGYEQRGVFVLLAPMGYGKTGIVGLALANHCHAFEKKFLAICHRVTLAGELARRLNLLFYTEPSVDKLLSKGNLSVCLPSITKTVFQSFVESTEVVFIDEISQVLRFLASSDHCSTPSASNRVVYDRLRTLVAQADCVAVADAHIDARTIKFLESCRPNEQFRIIEVPQPRDAGITADFYYGHDAQNRIVGHSLAELTSGGRVWIASDSKEAAKQLCSRFAHTGFRTIALHADNKNNAAQKRFLANIESECTKFDVVITSPIISSGVSVEHQGIPHEKQFTLGLYIGSGSSVTPNDAIQQMRRVRYLRRFIICLTPTSPAKRQTILSKARQLRAASLARSLEDDSPYTPDRFDDFVADILNQDARAKIDFAAGLIWQLEAAGWVLNNQSDSSDGSCKTNLKADNEYEKSLIEAQMLRDHEAQALQINPRRTEAQNVALEAYELRVILGVGDAPLTRQLVDLWDRGRILHQLFLFDCYQGKSPPKKRLGGSVVTEQHPLATKKTLALIFSEFDLNADIDQHSTQSLIEHVWKNRDLCYFLEIIKTPINKRPTDGVKLAKGILRRMGLKLTSKTVRVSGVPSTRKPGSTGNPQRRIHRLCRRSFEQMESISERRSRR